MALAEDVLSRLLQRGERAALSGSERAIQERFSDAGSDYWRMGLSERDKTHERFLAAEKAGAVNLKWARQGGEDRPLEVVRLRDLDKLATFIGAQTAASAIARAGEILAPWLASTPRVREILERWGALKNVRGLTPSAAGDFADALRVLDAAAASPDEDQIVRVLSARLFGDSKRIEHLVRHLDVLTGETFLATARHWDEVLSPLGLVKEPQPFLVAGAGHLLLADSEECPVVRPFVGVASKAITGYRGSPAWVLTIENLTPFHLASQLDGVGRGLVIYTGGMPSPAWARAYRSILASLPANVPVYHWGDVDVGGFRIAAQIRRHIVGDRSYLPWLMDASKMRGAWEAGEGDSKEMARQIELAGWSNQITHPIGFLQEQEQLTIHLPAPTSA
jgi:hypothetical protein